MQSLKTLKTISWQQQQKKSHRSLSSLIRSNFLSTSCSGSSSSSLKVFWKTPINGKKKSSLQIKMKYSQHHQACLISRACSLLHTSWVPTHSARDTTRRRSFVLGPLRAFSARTNDERTSSRCSLYFLSEITLFFTNKKKVYYTSKIKFWLFLLTTGRIKYINFCLQDS